MYDEVYSHLKPEAAEIIAREMEEGDEDGWTYRAIHAPEGKGLSFIEIYDEDGKYVGRL